MIVKEEKQYLTQEKLQEFKDELEYLKTTRRKEVAQNLEYAKALGDLAENAEYQEARELQANVEDRIMKLEMIIKSAQIVADRHGDVVEIGSTVIVQKADEKEPRKYKIVGSEEADMAQGKISNLSPIGSNLLGKKKGESFKVKTPKGEIGYKVISIE
jgi:transcription elongation factor GreA